MPQTSVRALEEGPWGANNEVDYTNALRAAVDILGHDAASRSDESRIALQVFDEYIVPIYLDARWPALSMASRRRHFHAHRRYVTDLLEPVEQLPAANIVSGQLRELVWTDRFTELNERLADLTEASASALAILCQDASEQDRAGWHVAVRHRADVPGAETGAVELVLRSRTHSEREHSVAAEGPSEALGPGWAVAEFRVDPAVVSGIAERGDSIIDVFLRPLQQTEAEPRVAASRRAPAVYAHHSGGWAPYVTVKGNLSLRRSA